MICAKQAPEQGSGAATPRQPDEEGKGDLSPGDEGLLKGGRDAGLLKGGMLLQGGSHQ